MNAALMAEIWVFALAVFVGIEVISKVPVVLHTPLMSGTNAIHGIVMLGGVLVVGLPWWLRGRGAAQRARAVRALGAQALGAASLDLALMAGLPLLKLSYAPVRRAPFNLLLGRAILAGAGTALALGARCCAGTYAQAAGGRSWRAAWRHTRR